MPFFIPKVIFVIAGQGYLALLATIGATVGAKAAEVCYDRKMSLGKVKLPPGTTFAGDIQLLKGMAKRVEGLAGVFVEVGSALGRSAVVIGLQARKLNTELYCIDIWNSGEWPAIAAEIGKAAGRYPKRPVDAYPQFLANIKSFGLSYIVLPIIGRSEAVLGWWERPLRFIFIDGCHEYSFVVKDVQWKKFLVVGGIIVFHDYQPSWPGVISAVNECIRGDRHFSEVARGGVSIAFKRERAE